MGDSIRGSENSHTTNNIQKKFQAPRAPLFVASPPSSGLAYPPPPPVPDATSATRSPTRRSKHDQDAFITHKSPNNIFKKPPPPPPSPPFKNEVTKREAPESWLKPDFFKNLFSSLPLGIFFPVKYFVNTVPTLVSSAYPPYAPFMLLDVMAALDIAEITYLFNDYGCKLHARFVFVPSFITLPAIQRIRSFPDLARLMTWVSQTYKPRKHAPTENDTHELERLISAALTNCLLYKLNQVCTGGSVTCEEVVDDVALGMDLAERLHLAQLVRTNKIISGRGVEMAACVLAEMGCVRRLLVTSPGRVLPAVAYQPTRGFFGVVGN